MYTHKPPTIYRHGATQLAHEKLAGTPPRTSAPVITPLLTTTDKHRSSNRATVTGANETGNVNRNPVFSPQKNSSDAPCYKISGFYSSPYIGDEFKPTNATLEISQELELLKPLILSQHEVFTQLIKDLGNINLVLSKIIEKKKESFNHLQNGTRIPRSLCIKCELTTSPSYSNNQDFLELKEALQEIVAKFVQEGAKIMLTWASKNLQLLIHNRCTNILEKALQILDGLTFFYLEIFGTPSWPSLPSHKYIPLFLFKLYFSNEYIETQDIVVFLELNFRT